MAGSITNNTLNNLSIAGKLGNLMSSTQGRTGGANEYVQTHSDAATTRRTTQQTQRTSGGNPSKGFHPLLAQSTYDASEGSGGAPTIKMGRKRIGKIPITQF